MIKDLIREYYQEKRIRGADQKARDVGRKHSNLQVETDRLHLVVEALWDIVKRQNNLADRDLLDIMYKIDLADGKLDGRSTRTAIENCSGCGKVLQKGIPACMYCGLAHELSPFDNR